MGNWMIGDWEIETGNDLSPCHAVTLSIVPARIASANAIVSSSGVAPNSSSRTRQQASNWARAAARCPLVRQEQHQPAVGLFTPGFQRQQAAGVGDSRGQIPLLFGELGQPVQPLRYAFPEEGALAELPMFKVWRIANVEPLQEVAPVERERLLGSLRAGGL